MKRRVIQRVVVLLLLLISGGAIVNVAVAWGCVIRAGYDTAPRPWQPPSTPTSADLQWWKTHAPSRMVQPNEVNEERHAVGFELRTLCGEGHMLPTTPPARLGEQSRRYKAGWPSRALAGEWFSYSAAESLTGHESSSKWLIEWDRGSRIGKYIPHVPIRAMWPGFAINTIFYAAILWVVFFVPGMLKRTLRRRRGQCPACAYPVGTSSVCTECGRNPL